MRAESFYEGDVIIRERESLESIYFVKEGEVAQI
jgi:CRP-like cAMP-binding protein